MITRFKEELQSVVTSNDLSNLKAKYLGKNSELSAMGAKMRGLNPEQKKELGEQLNALKTEIEDLLMNKLTEIENKKLNEEIDKEAIDVTLPGVEIPVGGLHPLTQLIWEIEDFFLGLGYSIEHGPEIENDEYNFTFLNIPPNHPARDMHDSFYFSSCELLRTHTSPVQIRTMLAKRGEPVKIICPGKVYRRDDDDATHSYQFMQCEGLVVGEGVTLADLNGTLDALLKHILGQKRKTRLRPSYFPFTEPSVEVDVSCGNCDGSGCNMCKHTGWIEVLGAGMVNEKVLTACGYDPNKVTGFAFGIGIERLTMFKYGITDIRAFYNNDIRFLKKFRRV